MKILLSRIIDKRYDPFHKPNITGGQLFCILFKIFSKYNRKNNSWSRLIFRKFENLYPL